ncbi:hypothetical protein WJX81_005273 [Elliptochloris bilobata]|uniref:Cyclic nucleotide-binding domain-containing protein n=1 Tax=Elliptochloris bilobata TaxID=381761 RepID=A0AAW1S5C0_9CHLO
MGRLGRPHGSVGTTLDYNTSARWGADDVIPLQGYITRTVETSSARRFRHRSIFGLPLVSASSKFALVEAIIATIIDLTYTAFLVPITLAFQPIAWSGWTLLHVVNLVAGLLYAADMAFNFHCSFVAVHRFKRRAVVDGRLVAWFYIRHGSFLVDLLSILPTLELCVVIAFANYHEDSWAVLALSLLRIARLLRLYRLIKHLMGFAASRLGTALLVWLPGGALYFSVILYSAAVMVNFLGCGWFLVARAEGYDGTWLSRVGNEDFSHASSGKQYLAALYFTITTLSTTGFGDIVAQNSLEQAVAMLYMFLGVCAFSVILSIMATIAQHASSTARRASTLGAKFEVAEAWMRMRHLPPTLHEKIVSFYQDVWIQKQEWREDELFAELPAALRGEVAGVLLLGTLRRIPTFAELPEAALQRMAAEMSPLTVFPGQDLSHQGEAADRIFVLAEGEALLVRDTFECELWSAPAVLGAGAALQGLLPEASLVRRATYRAETQMTVWILPTGALAALTACYPVLRMALIAEFRTHLEFSLANRVPLLHAGSSDMERLLARVERVQRQLAAAQRASRDPSPTGGQREEGARPHGLTRICSLGSRSMDDPLHLPPVDEDCAVFTTPETEDAVPGAHAGSAERGS